MVVQRGRHEPMFRRYNITSPADLKDAASKLDAANPDSSVTLEAEKSAQPARVVKIS
jgi:hypothetical protein